MSSQSIYLFIHLLIIYLSIYLWQWFIAKDNSAPRGHFWQSHWGGHPTGKRWAETRDTAPHPTGARMPYTRKWPIPHVTSARAEKMCPEKSPSMLSLLGPCPANPPDSSLFGMLSCCVTMMHINDTICIYYTLTWFPTLFFLSLSFYPYILAVFAFSWWLRY